MKVAINGGGIAGVSIAYWLEKYGFDVFLFEKKQHNNNEGYLINCWGPGYEVLKKMDIIESLEKRSIKLKYLRCHNCIDNISDTVEIESLIKNDYENFLSIKRHDLMFVLYDKLEKTKVQFNTHVLDFKQHNNKVNVSLSNGNNEDFDILIGADGYHSKIRSILFNEDEYEKIYVNSCTASFYVNHKIYNDPNYSDVYLGEDRQASLIYLNNNETICTLSFDKSLVDRKPQTISEKVHILQSIFKDFKGRIGEVLYNLNNNDHIFFDTIHQIKMNKWCKGRVALIGDSASAPSVLAGQGSIFALCEAYVLAVELVKNNSDYMTAFYEYEKQLNKVITEKQENSLTNLTFFIPEKIFSKYILPMKSGFQTVPLFNQIFGSEMLQYNLDLPIVKNT